MMRFWRKQPKENDLFTLQQTDEFELLEKEQGDAFFEEAFSDTSHSAQQQLKAFVGSVMSGRRFRLSAIGIGLVFLLFAGKASALQILNGEDYRLQAENNRTRFHTLPAQRGIVYDRNGVVIAENEPAFHLVTSKAQLPPDPSERWDRINAVADFFHRDVNELHPLIDETETPTEQVLILENIEYEDAMKFAAFSQDFPEFQLEVGSRRSYITDQIPSLSHVLGYTGIVNEEEFEEKRDEGYRRFDRIGKQGIESQYETLLRGSFGEETIEVDALGRTERIVSKRDPKNGENLHLTIDTQLQEQAEKILQARIQGTDAERASVIAMDPKTGEVLALVSWPAFDANLFTKGIDRETYAELSKDEDLPLFPRATAGEFPSGSTIKPVFAAAALNEGIITPTTTFLSVGGLSIGPWFFPDWRAGGHGVTNVYHAIADSVNTFFYIIGGGYEDFDGLGIDGLMDYASRFGFGRPTGLDLPGEAGGFLPNQEWKYLTKGEVWYIGDTYHAAIGQGDFLATPIQIAQSTATFANDGVRVTPHINMNLPVESEQVISTEIAEIIRDAMRQTVTKGSASSMQRVPVPVAGKTGTAQWSSSLPNHSWFTGFAPYEDPEIVVTVLVEEGGDASLAVPVARELLTWWFSRN